MAHCAMSSWNEWKDKSFKSAMSHFQKQNMSQDHCFNITNVSVHNITT